MTDDSNIFRPCYTWPNPAFPFRLYYESDTLRLFIIENIFHNYYWLSKHASGIRETDYFLVILGWTHTDWLVDHSRKAIEACGLRLDQFIILVNDYADFMIFSDYGFPCRLVNHNCWLDPERFFIQPNITKAYDAIYVARLTDFKRHYLARDVSNLALVAGELHGSSATEQIPPHAYINDRQLSPSEVLIKINESRCGLILSAIEGACFSSSEYLLCGIPVVSTSSQGGRSIWYNSYNSRIADATPESVAKEVKKIIETRPCPDKIRRHHIYLSDVFRGNFIELLRDLFSQNGLEINAFSYFREHYFHKMRESETPDFDALFPLN